MRKTQINFFYKAIFSLLFIFILLNFDGEPVFAAVEKIKAINESLVSRLAPGEILPISVKLSNFGNNQRIDIKIQYQILNFKKDVVVEAGDTVAVETTASFIKLIQLPDNLSKGRHTAIVTIFYPDQKFPAVSKFDFFVENKIAGIFVNQLIFFVIFIVILCLIFLILGRLTVKRARFSRLKPHEYSHIPKNTRIYYEIINDIIMQLRYHAGDKAINLVKEIRGLVIDENTGKVLRVTEDPAKIISALILRYKSMF
ncbi:MAG: hypothetical protein WC894_06395 [Patescibacteria group bacterium]